MATAFAAIEARIARAAVRHIANATATVPNAPGGAMEMDVVFDDGFIATLDGAVAATGPQALCDATEAAGLARNTLITIRSVDYTVTEAQPDGAGMVLLQLRKA